VGIFFMGPFLVIFPLLVRDVYGGDVRQLSLVMMLFPVGTILGSSVILLRGGIRRKGVSLLIALACGALALLIIGQGLPFPGFLALTLAWGVAGSVFMNSSRTLFQQAAPPESRARVLSVNQLGFMAAAPIGALIAGFASARLGPLDALVAAGSVMLVLVASVAALSRVRRME
jgi:predicted MFS family arabinose efflux permease